MVRFGLPGILGVLFLVLVSCDQVSNRVSVLWTDVPEMAAYVERFNASQREWQILVQFQDHLETLLTTPGVKADLVISRGLSSAAVKDSLVPLDFLFDGGNLAKASFYRHILDAGMQGDHFKLLPVSFDLPILEYAKPTLPDLGGFSIDLATLKTLNAQFNLVTSDKEPRKQAFLPRWQEFSLAALELEGASFQEGFPGTLTWNSERLNAALAMLRGWPSLPPDQVVDFEHKYLQADAAQPLARGRIEFYPSTLATFLSRPWDERRTFDFRFLDRGGKVLATPNTVWAGIPSSSVTRGAGERFLAWFFQGDNQKKLILESRKEDDRNFGLAQGLSALEAPNQSALVPTWPELEQRLPGIDQLAFWGSLPPAFDTINSVVLKPWLEGPQPTETALRAALDKYKSQATQN